MNPVQSFILDQKKRKALLSGFLFFLLLFQPFAGFWFGGERAAEGSVLPVSEGLALHLDADAITGLSDGDTIAQWDDLSGSSNHAVQGDSNRRPIYKVDIINGRPVARFSDDWLITPSMDIANKDVTWIIVINHSEARGQFVFDQRPGGPQAYFQRNTGVLNFDGGSGQAFDTESFIDFGQWHLVHIESTSSGKAVYDGGDLIYSDTVARSNYSNSELYIGSRHTTPTTTMLRGDVAEILVYNRALSGSERQQVEQFLGEKWLGWDPPVTDAAVIKIEPEGKPIESSLRKLIDIGFSHPRKTLANNLAGKIKNSSELIECGKLPAKIRAEKLSLEDWRRLHRCFIKSKSEL